MSTKMARQHMWLMLGAGGPTHSSCSAVHAPGVAGAAGRCCTAHTADPSHLAGPSSADSSRPCAVRPSAPSVAPSRNSATRPSEAALLQGEVGRGGHGQAAMRHACQGVKHPSANAVR